MARRVSFPKEHGAYFVLGAAIAASLCLAPHRRVVVGLGLALASAFLARGPLERIVARASLRAWDRPFIAALSLSFVASLLLAGGGERPALFGGATSATLLGGSLLARRRRLNRDAVFEAAGLFALGSSAALLAAAGGLAFRDSVVLGVVLGSHAAVSVPIVRSRLRVRQRRLGPRALVLGSVGLAAAALVVTALGHPIAALAFLPRVGEIVLRALYRRAGSTRVALVGARELAELATACLLVVTLR